jgi:hypothetical protein
MLAASLDTFGGVSTELVQKAGAGIQDIQDLWEVSIQDRSLTLILRDLQLKQPPRDFLCGLLVNNTV